MTTVIEATFDGAVFRPAEPVALKPNTSVRLTVEPLAPPQEPTSVLDVAEALHLEGPTDWSTNLDKYLYGEGARGDG
jgi:hypothetical protein